jgi:hypothetical protein
VVTVVMNLQHVLQIHMRPPNIRAAFSTPSTVYSIAAAIAPPWPPVRLSAFAPQRPYAPSPLCPSRAPAGADAYVGIEKWRRCIMG